MKAVSRALSQGHSVLITSHTHVAVDNVVESVAETVKKAGQVVRVGASGQLARKVSEHPWLTVDKAAAAITNRVARLQSIQDAMGENESHPDRLHLGVVVQRLEQGNGLRLESALRAQEAADRARHLAEDLVMAGAESARRRADFERIDAATAHSAASASALPQLRERAESAAITAHHSAHQVYAAEQSLASLRFELSNAVLEWSEATSARQSWSAGLPWRRHALDSRIQLANERRNILAADVHSAEAGVETFRRAAAAAGGEATSAHERVGIAESAQRRARELAREASIVQAAESAAQAHIIQTRAQYAEAQRVVDAVPDWEVIIAEGRVDGTLEALAERDDYNERVASLDTAMKELIRKKKLLDDEYAKTKSNLLETAPVIACTLSSLTTKTELANRRFDTVIVDEAASAQIPQLVYAGSKADHCLAFVGDFLQNAPITETDDAITEDDKRVLHWQEDDIFALHGVVDRASTERNSRCVALRTQYRYPPVIASIVNEFCYDGLLESSWRSDDDSIGPPYVVFVDTSTHPEQGLRRRGQSWTHPLGLDLIEAIHNRHREDSGTSMGVVCPYAAHAQQAEALTRRKRLAIECGTAHKFQGRQYDVVILDLMQDSGRLRWAAQADLSGSKREVSAAKLLNVGITRAQKRLYIIGDWSVVRNTPTPGMIAIANLLGEREFELVSAADALTIGTTRNR